MAVKIIKYRQIFVTSPGMLALGNPSTAKTTVLTENVAHVLEVDTKIYEIETDAPINLFASETGEDPNTSHATNFAPVGTQGKAFMRSQGVPHRVAWKTPA